MVVSWKRLHFFYLVNCLYYRQFHEKLEISCGTFNICCAVLSHSVVSDSVTRDPCQAPLSMEFSRQEYWSVLPFASPGDLPNPGIQPGSPSLQADSLPSESPEIILIFIYIYLHLYIHFDIV